MEQGALSRWLLIGLAVVIMVFVLPRWLGGGEEPLQPLRFDPGAPQNPGEPPNARVRGADRPERICDLWTPEFRAQLSTRGATVKHFELLTAKYQEGAAAIDLATTPEVPFRQQLLLHWRNPAAADPADRGPSMLEAKYWQVDYDLVSWKLEHADGKRCEFSYEDEKVRLTKVISATERPYELNLRATIENRAGKTLRHALTAHATTWRTKSEVEGSMLRVSPYVTHVECISDNGKATRLQPDDFEPKDFAEPPFSPNALHLGDWYQVEGAPDVVAVSNAYFSNALLPVSGPVAPQCQLQIEKMGGKQDPHAGAMYRARLAYPQVELKAGAAAEYELLGYFGPKERRVLAAAAGGQRKLGELIDLGFFSAIAKVLVAFLLSVYSSIPNWGVAIVVLTITARVLLFPLTIPMIRNSIRMRELKPEMDALNEKFKDDAQGKGMAQMELWRKHKVNPMKGCLPQLATMPVWFALYTTLQTAVELYNIPFLWFPDLSEPDPLFILPFIIGGTGFLQQKLMPMTGGDPAQQKMMLYMMPGMFTVFMLFLPAGLGVYMFTNSLLGIAQQQMVEWHVRRATKAKEGKGPKLGSGGADFGGGEPKEEARQARIHGKRKPKIGSPAKISESNTLLGKGKGVA